MKPYSSELREKIVKIYEQGDTSIRKVAARLDVSKGFVQKILKQKQTTGHVQPKQQGGSLKSVLIPLLQKYATIARSAGKDNRMKVNYQERIEDTATELKIIMLYQFTMKWHLI
jgi:transposase